MVGDELSKAHACPGCGAPLKRRTARCAACESKEATKRLIEIAANNRQHSHNPDAHDLLARWNALHGVRTVLSVVAFAVMLLGVAR